jgi:hypothetical protein
MANEFVARNGIIAQDNSIISGSLLVNTLTSGSAVCTSINGRLISYNPPPGVMVAGTGTCSIVGSGTNNCASGNCSFTGGGQSNTSSGDLSTVVGGCLNSNSALISSIVGGLCNSIDINATGAFIGAGTCNTSCGSQSSVVGGSCNRIDIQGANSFIGAGTTNQISGSNSFIGGGGNHRVSSNNSSIVGGGVNFISSSANSSFIGNGNLNTIVNGCSSIVGGIRNTTSGSFSFIGGGSGSIACGDSSVIVGGCSHTACGTGSFIGGGFNNTTTANYAGVFGCGLTNSTACSFMSNQLIAANLTSGSAVCADTNGRLISYIAGGGGIIIEGTGCNSTVRCGVNNIASGTGSFAGGGVCNTASGDCSAILGGSSNTASGTWSGVFGCGLTNSTACSFMSNQLLAANLTSGSAVCAGASGILVSYTPAAAGVTGTGTTNTITKFTGTTTIGNSIMSESGSVITISGTLTETSALKYKENIKTIDGALDSVLKMRGVTYNKIGNDNKEIGVIAEEVYEVVPELITFEDGEINSVAYARTVALLIEAIKEQQKQIDELKILLNSK